MQAHFVYDGQSVHDIVLLLTVCPEYYCRIERARREVIERPYSMGAKVQTALLGTAMIHIFWAEPDLLFKVKGTTNRVHVWLAFTASLFIGALMGTFISGTMISVNRMYRQLWTVELWLGAPLRIEKMDDLRSFHYFFLHKTSRTVRTHRCFEVHPFGYVQGMDGDQKMVQKLPYSGHLPTGKRNGCGIYGRDHRFRAQGCFLFFLPRSHCTMELVLFPIYFLIFFQIISRSVLSYSVLAACAAAYFGSNVLTILALCANISDNQSHIRMLHQEKKRLQWRVSTGKMDDAADLMAEIDSVCDITLNHDKRPKVVGIPMTWPLYFAMLGYVTTAFVSVVGSVVFGD